MTDTSKQVLVIGIGNSFRCDDGLGGAVARKLKALHLDGVEIIEQSGEGASLMEAWKGFDRVILVDAVLSGEEPGTFFRLDSAVEAIPKNFFQYSTHNFSVAEAVEMARKLNLLPPHLVLFGVEGQDFEEGRRLSSPVIKVLPKVIGEVQKEIQALLQL